MPPGDLFPLRVCIQKSEDLKYDTDLLIDQVRAISNSRFCQYLVNNREVLGEVIRRVVAGGESSPQAIASLGIEPADLDVFTRLAEEELTHLAIYNCARYRLTIPAVERWIAAGRPGILRKELDS